MRDPHGRWGWLDADHIVSDFPTDAEREALADRWHAALTHRGDEYGCADCAADMDLMLPVLAPLVAAREAAAEQRGAVKALREAADEIDAELVCCDVYAEREGRGIPHSHRHQICYWASAAAGINRHRADEMEG